MIIFSYLKDQFVGFIWDLMREMEENVYDILYNHTITTNV